MSDENALFGARVAMSTFPVTAEEARAFMQRRIALWTRAVSIGIFTSYVGLNVLLAIQPNFSWRAWLSIPAAWIPLFIAAWIGAFSAWCGSDRVRLSHSVLSMADAAATIKLGAILVFGVVVGFPYLNGLEAMRSIGLSRMVALQTLVPVILLTNVVYMRALIVPSSAKRTLVLSLAAMMFLMATNVISASSQPGSRVPLDLGITLIWSALPVAGAAAASFIIQGLRRKVQEAAQLGQYTLIEKIGEGGMGAVFKAKHALLRRPTAIKLLPPDRASPADRARFEREVQLTSQLTHPNTVAVYDYGHTPDGVFYYAMEYIPGVDLQALIEEDGPQPPARVIHILMQIAGALSEAHAIGLIHRDIKPANVLLCQRPGASDVVKVVDFGLVKEVQGAGNAAVTQAEGVVGTPFYISPEALRTPRSVDARADIYSVGAVGYFLLVGEPVFTGNSVVEVCSHHLLTAPTPPSARLGRAVPEDLEQLILRCLEKDPDARPSDAALLRDRLAECEDAGRWTDADARALWQERDGRIEREKRVALEMTATMPVDLRGRGADH
jgi:serine/threonine-protein kinase